MALALTLAGFSLTTGLILWYLAVINKERAPVRVGAFRSGLVIGIGLAVAGTLLEPSLLTGLLLGATTSVGGLILWLLTQRRVPDGNLVAELGQPMPALSAADHTGAPFDLASLKGQRVLVKFFRGSW